MDQTAVVGTFAASADIWLQTDRQVRYMTRFIERQYTIQVKLVFKKGFWDYVNKYLLELTTANRGTVFDGRHRQTRHQYHGIGHDYTFVHRDIQINR